MKNKKAIFIINITAFMFFLSCKSNSEHGVPFKRYEEIKILTEKLSHLKFDTACKVSDTLVFSLTDSAQSVWYTEEEMINMYLLQEVFRSDTGIKWIRLTKEFPLIKSSSRFEVVVPRSEASAYMHIFDNTRFYSVASYLLHSPDSRELLFIFNMYWAVLKNGDLKKSWSENFFELLYPFMAECDNGKPENAHVKMEQLKSLILEKLPENKKRSVIKAFKFIYDTCDQTTILP